MVKDTDIEAVILASGTSEIWGGHDELPTALLPVCGKSLLAHRIDELRAIGVRGLTIISDRADAIAAALPELPVHQLPTRLLTPGEVPVLTSGRIILTGARHFAEPVLATLVPAGEPTRLLSRDQSVLGSVMGREEALTLLGGGDVAVRDLHSMARRVSPATVRDLLALNLAVLRGELTTTRISGFQVAQDVYLEWSRSARPANINGAAHIGDGAALSPTARLRDSVIGRNAVIPAHTRLERCVVLEGVTAPRGAQLSDALLTHNLTLFAEEEAPLLLEDRIDTASGEFA